MEKIKKIDEYYSERIQENQLKLDYISENVDDSEALKLALEFLKNKDKEIDGIYEDTLDYIIEKIN